MVPERLTAARTALVLEQPFFGVLALSVDLRCSDTVPTVATDGKSVLFNPVFLDSLPQNQVIGVLANEVLHCANGHPWRRDQRDPVAWNVACDLAINPILIDAGFSLPDGALRERSMDGKSAEWIYDRLPKTKSVQAALKGSGDGAGDGGSDVLDGDLNGAAFAQAEWAERVKQAANAAQAYGKLPIGCERFVDIATAPKVDWRSVMRRFVQMNAREDYSWSRMNRRYLSQGMYLPSLHSERLGPVAVAVDTSGSIDAVTLTQFCAELNAIVEDVRPIRTHVIYCDAAVHGIDTFESDDPICLMPKGGGGTAFGPALDAAEALDDTPCCVVYLTDLDGEHRRRAPEIPLLWVTTGVTDAPYGEVVRLE